MHAFLSKVFGRKKDDKDTDSSPTALSPGELLDGKFEAVSPNVSPIAANFLELDPKADGGKDKEGEKDPGFSLFSAKSRLSPPEVGPKKLLDTLPHLSLNFDEPKAESSSRGYFNQDLDTDALLTDAIIGQRRLNPLEALVLIRACSQAIMSRGLETLGIMTPHWYSASPDIQRRLISQFIHSLTPKSPATALSPASPSPISNFESEINFTRSPHDIAAVLRWGLRHLQLEGDHFGSDEGWYHAFLVAEAAAEYPPKAFSEKLAPKLPTAHLDLLVATLEIFSSLAAYSETNSISGSKLSKIFGLWLLTARQVEDKDDWATFYARWERTGRMLEHLFLARVRDEATDQRMPIRLLDLVRKYPFTQGLSPPTTDLQLLPRPRLTTTLHDALFVRINIELPSLKRKAKSRVHPVALLADAFSTINVEEGEYLELWAKIRLAAKGESNNPSLSNVFADETIRFLSLVPDGHGSKDDVKSPSFSLLSPSSPRKRAASVGERDKPIASTSQHTKPATDPPPITPLSPLAIGSDWGQFSASGFLDLSPGIAPLASTLFDTDIEKTIPPNPTASGTLSRKSSRRGKATPSRKSVDIPRSVTVAGSSAEGSTEGSSEAAEPSQPQQVVTASKLNIIQLDEAFIDFWSDALLDPISANWPVFIICKFKSTLVPELVYGADTDNKKTLKWLVLEQAYSVRPPLPPPTPPTAIATEVTPRPISPSAQSASGKKRFSFWSVSRTPSSSSVGSSKGKKPLKTPKIGEMGELLEEESKDVKKDTVKLKSPVPKSRKSVDISGSTKKVEEDQEEIKAADEGPSTAVVAAVATGASAAGAAAALMTTDAVEKGEAEPQPAPLEETKEEVALPTEDLAPTGLAITETVTQAAPVEAVAPEASFVESDTVPLAGVEAEVISKVEEAAPVTIEDTVAEHLSQAVGSPLVESEATREAETYAEQALSTESAGERTPPQVEVAPIPPNTELDHVEKSIVVQPVEDEVTFSSIKVKGDVVASAFSESAAVGDIQMDVGTARIEKEATPAPVVSEPSVEKAVEIISAQEEGAPALAVAESEVEASVEETVGPTIVSEASLEPVTPVETSTVETYNLEVAAEPTAIAAVVEAPAAASLEDVITLEEDVVVPSAKSEIAEESALTMPTEEVSFAEPGPEIVTEVAPEIPTALEEAAAAAKETIPETPAENVDTLDSPKDDFITTTAAEPESLVVPQMIDTHGEIATEAPEVEEAAEVVQPVVEQVATAQIPGVKDVEQTPVAAEAAVEENPLLIPANEDIVEVLEKRSMEITSEMTAGPVSATPDPGHAPNAEPQQIVSLFSDPGVTNVEEYATHTTLLESAIPEVAGTVDTPTEESAISKVPTVIEEEVGPPVVQSIVEIPKPDVEKAEEPIDEPAAGVVADAEAPSLEEGQPTSEAAEDEGITISAVKEPSAVNTIKERVALDTIVQVGNTDVAQEEIPLALDVSRSQPELSTTAVFEENDHVLNPDETVAASEAEDVATIPEYSGTIAEPIAPFVEELPTGVKEIAESSTENVLAVKEEPLEFDSALIPDEMVEAAEAGNLNEPKPSDAPVVDGEVDIRSTEEEVQPMVEGELMAANGGEDEIKLEADADLKLTPALEMQLEDEKVPMAEDTKVELEEEDVLDEQEEAQVKSVPVVAEGASTLLKDAAKSDNEVLVETAAVEEEGKANLDLKELKATEYKADDADIEVGAATNGELEFQAIDEKGVITGIQGSEAVLPTSEGPEIADASLTSEPQVVEQENIQVDVIDVVNEEPVIPVASFDTPVVAEVTLDSVAAAPTEGPLTIAEGLSAAEPATSDESAIIEQLPIADVEEPRADEPASVVDVPVTVDTSAMEVPATIEEPVVAPSNDSAEEPATAFEEPIEEPAVSIEDSSTPEQAIPLVDTTAEEFELSALADKEPSRVTEERAVPAAAEAEDAPVVQALAPPLADESAATNAEGPVPEEPVDLQASLDESVPHFEAKLHLPTNGSADVSLPAAVDESVEGFSSPVDEPSAPVAEELPTPAIPTATEPVPDAEINKAFTAEAVEETMPSVGEVVSPVEEELAIVKEDAPLVEQLAATEDSSGAIEEVSIPIVEESPAGDEVLSNEPPVAEEPVKHISSEPRFEPMSIPDDTSAEALVDLPPVPVVETVPITEPIETITVPLAELSPEEEAPSAEVSESATLEEAPRLSPAADAIVQSGSTPGPAIVLSTSEPADPDTESIQIDKQIPELEDDLARVSTVSTEIESSAEVLNGTGNKHHAELDEDIKEVAPVKHITPDGPISINNLGKGEDVADESDATETRNAEDDTPLVGNGVSEKMDEAHTVNTMQEAELLSTLSEDEAVPSTT